MLTNTARASGPTRHGTPGAGTARQQTPKAYRAGGSGAEGGPATTKVVIECHPSRALCCKWVSGLILVST